MSSAKKITTAAVFLLAATSLGALADPVEPKIDGPVLKVKDTAATTEEVPEQPRLILFDDEDESFQDPFGRGCSSGYHPTS